jgi:hypothetical protein
MSYIRTKPTTDLNITEFMETQTTLLPTIRDCLVFSSIVGNFGIPQLCHQTLIRTTVAGDMTWTKCLLDDTTIPHSFRLGTVYTGYSKLTNMVPRPSRYRFHQSSSSRISWECILPHVIASGCSFLLPDEFPSRQIPYINSRRIDVGPSRSGRNWQDTDAVEEGVGEE